MENKIISFWDFCKNFSGYTTLANVRDQYTEFCKLMASESFMEFLQSGEFSSRVDFAFKAQRKFGVSVNTSTFIYEHHVKK